MRCSAGLDVARTLQLARRMRPCLTLLVLGFASSAQAAPSAEDELALSQLELSPRRYLLVETVTSGSEGIDQTNAIPLDPYVRTAAFAQVTGGGDGGGGVAAGAALAVGGIGCDFLSGSAQGRFRPLSRDDQLTGQASYGVCLSRVALTFAFSGSAGVGLAPGLSDRRSLWSRRYAATYSQVEAGGGELWDPRRDSGGRHTLLSMVFGHGETTQVDGIDTRKIVTLDLDVALYRYRRVEGFAVDAVVLTSNALKAGSDDHGGIASAFFPVRVRYDTDDLFVRGAAGWGFSGGRATQSSETAVNGEVVDSWTETIDGEGLPEMTIFVGNLEAGIRRDRITASTAISRSLYPTFDGNIAREARIEGQVSYVAGRTRRTQLALSPFATRTRTWTRDDGDSRDVATGASLHFGRELTEQLRVDAIGEAGVSPYARLDRERLPGSHLGGQVLVALSGRVTDFTGRLTTVQR
jgi:hypothetical protein